MSDCSILSTARICLCKLFSQARRTLRMSPREMMEEFPPPLVIRRPAPGSGRPCDVPLPPPLKTKVDIVKLLLEDRGKR